jgi:1-acyl-sn-glycerol-3-phosphate acyltransferase
VGYCHVGREHRLGTRTEGGAVLYWVIKVILTPILHVCFRPEVEGVENLPEDGCAILASNHTSWMDWIFLPLVSKRRIFFLAKSDYFTESGFKGRMKKAFFAGTGQVPIDRSGGAASEAALTTGLRILGEGKLLGIYPEGTRTPDGRLYRGKTGPARMALESGAQVIPVAMIGVFDVAPPGVKMPRIRRVAVKIGTPLDFSRYAGMADDRFVLRSMTDEIMYEIMQLSGQQYVDMYATKAKQKTPPPGVDAEEAGEDAVAEPVAIAVTPPTSLSVDPMVDVRQPRAEERQAS